MVNWEGSVLLDNTEWMIMSDQRLLTLVKSDIKETLNIQSNLISSFSRMSWKPKINHICAFFYRILEGHTDKRTTETNTFQMVFEEFIRLSLFSVTHEQLTLMLTPLCNLSIVNHANRNPIKDLPQKSLNVPNFCQIYCRYFALRIPSKNHVLVHSSSWRQWV